MKPNNDTMINDKKPAIAGFLSFVDFKDFKTIFLTQFS